MLPYFCSGYACAVYSFDALPFEKSEANETALLKHIDSAKAERYTVKVRVNVKYPKTIR